MSEDSKPLHRTVPLKESITAVSGYPDKLVIFKLPASKFWWCRYYTQKRVLKRSTKTEDKREALQFAKKFYEEILLRERNLLPLGKSESFERCSEELLAEQAQLIQRGERNEKINLNDRQKLKKDILPFFKGFNLKDITYKHLNAYVAKLSERGLKQATIKVHLNLIHKILMLAMREGMIEAAPMMPRVKLKDSPRGWLTADEYEHLRSCIKEMIDEEVVVRYHKITDELRHLTTFIVNTFLRPSDVKHLRHRNIQIINSDHTYLRIQTEKSKTVNTPIVSMEAAVRIYADLCNLQKQTGRPCGKDDFVFFPHLPNREFALQTMRRQFDAALDRADLKTAATGEPRTLYSLRHTAIMFRLTLGENIDLLTLARNARTSVEMIERFYAKPLQAEMNVDKIQSMRKATGRNKKTTGGKS
jgi:site-specific recombinase XerD